MKKLLKAFLYSVLFFVTVLVVCAIAFYAPNKPYAQVKAKYSLSNSQFTPIMGMPAHYTVQGQGPNLVLLHGTASSLHTWDGWAQKLATNFKVIRFDLPGFGLTGHNPSNDYSKKMYLNFINQMLQHLGVEKCYMAGNSFGGDLAWNYAIEYADKVEKLILVDASGYPVDPSKVLGFKLATNPITRPLTKRFTPKALVKKSVQQVYGNPNLVSENLVQRYYDLLLMEENRDGLNQRIIQYKSNQSDIKKVEQPTLVMWGKKDVLIPFSDAQSFMRDLPNAQLAAFDELGHVPMEEAPIETALAARKFLLMERE